MDDQSSASANSRQLQMEEVDRHESDTERRYSITDVKDRNLFSSRT